MDDRLVVRSDGLGVHMLEVADIDDGLVRAWLPGPTIRETLRLDMNAPLGDCPTYASPYGELDELTSRRPVPAPDADGASGSPQSRRDR